MGLTIKQPWAAAIVHGPKRYENRSWYAPRTFQPGNYIALHAGKTVDKDPMTDYFIYDRMGIDIHQDLVDVLGAIVGVAKFEGSFAAEEVDDPWASGPVCWKFSEVVAIDPVPCRGQQGLWSLPSDILSVVRAAWRDAQFLAEASQ